MESHFLDLSPFKIKIDTNSTLAVSNLKHLYSDIYQRYSGQVFDYSIGIKKASGIRRFFKPQAQFFCDQHEPFKPLTYDHAFAFLEWGLNWTIAAHEMQYVIIHSAVLAKGDKAILFPAPPGSGKSTLTTYLAFNGWRLLSDEMALVIPNSINVQPFVRPICLKNDSITLAKKWFSEGRFSTMAKHTHKGDVIHLSPPLESWKNRDKAAEIVAVVFPKYENNSSLSIYALNQAQGFMQLAENSFNFSVLGDTGFNTACHLIESVPSFEVKYADLTEVENFLSTELI